MTREERIEVAIVAARKVAASPEARELHRRSSAKGDKAPAGTWSGEDERRLRERGEIVTPGGVYRLRGDPAKQP